MKKYLPVFVTVVLLVFSSSPAQAIEGYYTHWWTPYSPSCVFTLTAAYDPNTQGENQILVSETISLGSADTSSPPVQIEMQVIRRACTEENRSALFMLLRNPSEMPYKAPKVTARIESESYKLRLSEEPNTRVEDNASKTYTQDVMFVIDGADIRVVDNAISADQYNGAFRLIVEDTGETGHVYEYDLPANNPELTPKRKLLNGRFSGTWVAEGTEDQGFQLSIQELLTSGSMRPHAFLTWYTFDNDGNMLWLSGAGIFGFMGDSHVSLNMDLVTNGEFMGSKKAERRRLSDAMLRVENCNRLIFNYDLEELGLGKGTVFLKRIFSLETSGYACRDVQRRLDTVAE
jgi:hypothetical protein